jgi:type 1 glutamine amidotransferase
VKLNVLIFSKTKGYRHESIQPGGAALKSYFEKYGITSTQSEDSSVFNGNNLSAYDAILFFQTTGNVLDSIQQIAFQKFIRSGKGFVGIHSAADTEYDWPWFVDLLGVQFADHPDIQTATVVKTDTSFIACKHLPDRWTRTDEWYNFKKLPVNVRVLLSVDEATYQGGIHGANHPISWCHEYDGGRSFYTAMGHTVENYQDTLFLEHIMQGVRWASGRFD